MAPSQTTSHLLLVRPASFGFNQETAIDNVFQAQPTIDENTVQAKAVHEFNQLVNVLIKHKIDVTVVEDEPSLKTTDAVFPNNWVSFHENGTVCLYPMLSTVRRRERRTEVLDIVKKRFRVDRVVDLTAFEKNGKFLEGTGSMILDHENSIVYVCLSKRSHLDVVEKFSEELACYNNIVSFEAFDRNGQPVYHTNVLMCLGKDFAVICMDSIKDEKQKAAVASSLRSSGKTIVEITMEQMYNFAGNMLQVSNSDGNRFLVMSTRAFRSLTRDQIVTLESFNQKILHSNLSTIEGAGGGSARCMIAEIFLPDIAQ